MEPTNITVDQITFAAQAYAFEKLQDLDKRNEYAMKLWNTEGIRNVVFKNEHGFQFRVETWWDNQSKNWVTQTFRWGLSPSGEGNWYEFADAEYTGYQIDASIAHLWAITRVMFPKA